MKPTCWPTHSQGGEEDATVEDSEIDVAHENFVEESSEHMIIWNLFKCNISYSRKIFSNKLHESFMNSPENQLAKKWQWWCNFCHLLLDERNCVCWESVCVLLWAVLGIERNYWLVDWYVWWPHCCSLPPLFFSVWLPV